MTDGNGQGIAVAVEQVGGKGDDNLLRIAIRLELDICECFLTKAHPEVSDVDFS